MNKVWLIGNLGKDPEKQTTKGGKSYASFSLATTDGWGDNKETNWHKIVAFGKLSEIVLSYFRQGAQVAVVGRISYYVKENEGVKITRTTIIADEAINLERKEREAINLERKEREAVQSDDVPF